MNISSALNPLKKAPVTLALRPMTSEHREIPTSTPAIYRRTRQKALQ